MAPSEHKTPPPTDANLKSGEIASVPMVPAVRDTPPTPISKKRRRLWIFGAFIGAAVGLLALLQFMISPAPTVPVEIATLAPVTRILGVNGRIEAMHSVDVRSQVTGSISALFVEEGDLVETDQVLAKIDDKSQNAVVRQAIAGLDAALVAQQQAKQAYERAVSLGSNIAQAILETRSNDVQAATQEVARQTAVLELAQIDLENHTIQTPLSGRVLTLDPEVGQIVSPLIPFATVVDTGNLIVEADVDEAYATQIARGQSAILQLAGETATHPGRVSFVSTRVDVATGGLAIKIAFDTPMTAPIGLTVTANIIVDSQDAALTIPRTALLSGSDGQGVLLVREETAVFAPLTVLEWPAARLIVTEGLAEGDVVITDATGINAGQAVSVERP